MTNQNTDTFDEVSTRFDEVSTRFDARVADCDAMIACIEKNINDDNLGEETLRVLRARGVFNEAEQKPVVEITEDEISKLFIAFNKQRILSKHNHLCCSNCASIDLCDEAAKSDSHIGIAYNHEQDADRFATDPTRLTIRYCQTDDDKYLAEHIGMIITFIARQQGFAVDWDGDAGKVIYLRK